MFYRCPLKLVTSETVGFIRLYRHYIHGYLPVAGGILDQTPGFLEAMEIIEGEVGGQAGGRCPLLGPSGRREG